jgi:hypothetical protein
MFFLRALRVKILWPADMVTEISKAIALSDDSALAPEHYSPV